MDPRPAPSPPSASPQRPATSPAARLLERLPWEGVLIWGLVLLVIYILRDFFFVIFMTFILTYIMRSVVVRVLWMLTRRRTAPILERVLAVVCFAALGYGVYEGARLLGPPMQRQYEALVGRIKEFDPERALENFGSKTVGAWFFNEKYGGRDDERYQEAFKKFVENEGRPQPTAFERIEKLRADVSGGFDERFDEMVEAEIGPRIDERVQDQEAFEAWVVDRLEREFEELPVAKKRQRIEEWEAAVTGVAGKEILEVRRREPDFEAWRKDRVIEHTLRELRDDPEGLKKYREQWREEVAQEVREAWRASGERERFRREKLRDWYEKRRQEQPETFAYPFERYLELKKAMEKANEEDDRSIFYDALGDDTELSEEERRERLHRDFVLQKQIDEWDKWLKESPIAIQIKQFIEDHQDQAVSTGLGWARSALGTAGILAFQIPLSLLLSFFITFDIPRLRKGVRRLKESRVKGLYEEIAPGLVSFGHLIGRAFQAQAVIAIFNTLLTFLAIHWLGVENEVFLCAIVFFCSFIPVLGVVLSSVPIALMAIIQPNGSIVLALEMVAAIVVIHFIETSVLNPKILGDMLHLHPVLVLAVLAVGEHFFGVWGLLLGVPVAVYIIRFVILDEGIPGLIAPPRVQPAPASGPEPGGEAPGPEAESRSQGAGPPEGEPPAAPSTVEVGAGEGSGAAGEASASRRRKGS